MQSPAKVWSDLMAIYPVPPASADGMFPPTSPLLRSRCLTVRWFLFSYCHMTCFRLSTYSSRLLYMRGILLALCLFIHVCMCVSVVYGGKRTVECVELAPAALGGASMRRQNAVCCIQTSQSDCRFVSVCVLCLCICVCVCFLCLCVRIGRSGYRMGWLFT